jgi:hypothetical protein
MEIKILPITQTGTITKSDQNDTKIVKVIITITATTGHSGLHTALLFRYSRAPGLEFGLETSNNDEVFVIFNYGKTFQSWPRLLPLACLCFMPGSCFFLLSLLFAPNMEAISSETSADFEWTTQRYITEDSALHNHRCESFKAYK